MLHRIIPCERSNDQDSALQEKTQLDHWSCYSPKKRVQLWARSQTKSGVNKIWFAFSDNGSHRAFALNLTQEASLGRFKVIAALESAGTAGVTPTESKSV